MTELITPKQLQFLNILLTENLGAEYRKPYLELFWKVKSSKELTKEQASEIITKFLDENPAKEKNIALAIHKIQKELGQKSMFPWIVD